MTERCVCCGKEIPEGRQACPTCEYDEIHIALERGRSGFSKNIAHGREKKVSQILDSGERRTFSTGSVRDIQEGKGRMDLLPWSAIIEVSKHCENGAKKYGEHNVDRGIPLHSFIDSAFRHLAKYIEGWNDEPHLIAASWNLLWAIQTEIKHPELKDIPWRGNNESKDTAETDK